jgi:hypothetical protein
MNNILEGYVLQDVNHLSLKDFIKSTLIDINDGIKEAADEGVSIAYRETNSGWAPACKSVDFDIAVQVSQNEEKGKKKGGEFGISVLNFNLGNESTNGIGRETTNRIKFSVDVFLGSKIEKDQ